MLDVSIASEPFNLTKKIFLLLFLSLNIFALEKLNLTDHSLPENSKILLKSIEKHAIRLGKGSGYQTYIFVDPMCPHSKKYITKIIQNKKALEINSYYIFLYKLPKYDSSKLSQHIYKSHTPLKTLQDVMVANNTANVASTELDKKQENILNEITKVAIELKIHIRPYVMRFQKNSSFCTVSSGTAPCMEEYDFE